MFSFTVSDSSVISYSEDGWEDKAGHTSKPGLVSPDYCVLPPLWSCPAADLCGRRLKILHSIVLHTPACQDTPPGLNTDKDILGNSTRNRIIGQRIDSCSVIAALYSGRDGTMISPAGQKRGQQGRNCKKLAAMQHQSSPELANNVLSTECELCTKLRQQSRN